MRLKEFILKELSVTLVILSMLLGTVKLVSLLNSNANFDTALSPFIPLLTMILISMIFGAFLALPMLIERWNEDKGFNWYKFLIQGLPALILAMPLFVVFSLLNIKSFNYNLIPWYNLQAFSYNDYLVLFSSIWFGKTLVDCIKGLNNK